MIIKNAPKKTVPISQVINWKKNPRNITKPALSRLRNQIIELGIYNTLVCCHENGKYITLGGNMRLRILKELKQETVEIAIVKAKTDAMKLKYALSDNDNAGTTDDQGLAELAFPNISEINLDDYSVDRGETVRLSKMMDGFAPGGTEEQARLEKIAEKQDVTCPACGAEFIP